MDYPHSTKHNTDGTFEVLPYAQKVFLHLYENKLRCRDDFYRYMTQNPHAKVIENSDVTNPLILNDFVLYRLELPNKEVVEFRCPSDIMHICAGEFYSVFIDPEVPESNRHYAMNRVRYFPETHYRLPDNLGEE
jgi:hypothetical protein